MEPSDKEPIIEWASYDNKQDVQTVDGDASDLH
jgi:hypothetical protein